MRITPPWKIQRRNNIKNRKKRILSKGSCAAGLMPLAPRDLPQGAPSREYQHLSAPCPPELQAALLPQPRLLPSPRPDPLICRLPLWTPHQSFGAQLLDRSLHPGLWLSAPLAAGPARRGTYTDAKAQARAEAARLEPTAEPRAVRYTAPGQRPRGDKFQDSHFGGHRLPVRTDSPGEG